MALSIFGAGLPRTGTLSLKRAVDHLGFGPCFHPVDMQDGNALEGVLKAALNGNPIDWDLVFEGYNGAFDVPASYFYRDLMQSYPQAKLVLTVRDDVEAWYRSHRKLKELLKTTSCGHDPFWWAREHNSITVFGKSLVDMALSDNRDEIIEAYRQHNAAVIAASTPGRILVFDVRSGWEPLCQFLCVPIPQDAFPAVNSIGDLASSLSRW